MLGALILWILLAPAIAELIPLLVEFAFLLLRFVLLVVWTAVSTAGALLFRALWLGMKLGWRAGRAIINALDDAALLLWLFVQECRLGPCDEHEDGHGEDEDETAGRSLYEQACACLGLTQGFTREALQAAYKGAIVKAHPDRPGGSAERAKAINGARDLLLRAHGWA
jgi:hypothetical protein